ncbi:acyl-CoA thioesterase [Oceanobacillus bengalensis]|uniref:Acyl-CoA thioesterase n=1 Tax=Oceanobacillus bengalensis TaxID=1435466 RepID=A0A494Z607_9BACI|nr:thioesterase family protein [Oceanobacillus bengalensis]RKQ17968.1 acyl-CoA thioesterase [Oceanobacillus bengalensis]
MKSIDYIEDFDSWKSEFRFSIPIKIRFSETDMYGHVNNVSAFIYFEEGRIDFMNELGLADEMKRDQGAVIVSDLKCDYQKQMFFNDRIHLYVKANHVGNTSVDIHYMAVNENGEVTLTGRGRLVYIDVKTAIPKALTDTMKERLLNSK